MTPQIEKPPRACDGSSDVSINGGNTGFNTRITRKYQAHWLSERGMDRRQSREFARLWFGETRDV